MELGAVRFQSRYHSVMCVTPNVMIYTEQFLVFKTPKTNHFYNSTDHHISIYYAV